MTDPGPDVENRESFPSSVALVLTIVSLAVGLQLVAAGSRNAVGGGVLLLVAALAFTALTFAQGAYGPASEGALDLSARLGLGLLGGLLGALAVRITVWLTASIGVLDLLGLRTGSWQDAIGLGLSAGPAVFGGIAFGVLYAYVPGSSYLSRGIVAGLAGAAYVLFKALPLDRQAGWLGLEYGALAFLAVALFGLVWGVACSATIAWGARGEEAPVSRHLG